MRNFIMGKIHKLKGAQMQSFADYSWTGEFAFVRQESREEAKQYIEQYSGGKWRVLEEVANDTPLCVHIMPRNVVAVQSMESLN